MVTSIYLLIAGTTYLWIKFFFGQGDAIPFIPNTVLTGLAFATFVVHLSWQLFPRASLDTRSRILMAVISVLFIPLLIVCFAHAYRDFGVGGKISNMDHIYFSVVTFTTLGYGDIAPTGTARVFAVLQAISGFLFVPLLISQLINTTKEAGDEMIQREKELADVREIINRND